MQLDNVFGIAGTALNAQSIRMNTTASNLATQEPLQVAKKKPFVAKNRSLKL